MNEILFLYRNLVEFHVSSAIQVVNLQIRFVWTCRFFRIPSRLHNGYEFFAASNVAKACNLTPFLGHLKLMEGKSINHDGKTP